jgi:hypothetical protein
VIGLSGDVDALGSNFTEDPVVALVPDPSSTIETTDEPTEWQYQGPGKGALTPSAISRRPYPWRTTHSHNKLMGNAQLSSKLTNLVLEELAEGLNELHSLSLDHTLCNESATDTMTT